MYYTGLSRRPNEPPWNYNQSTGNSVRFEAAPNTTNTTQAPPSGLWPGYQPSPKVPIVVLPQDTPIEHPRAAPYYAGDGSDEQNSVGVVLHLCVILDEAVTYNTPSVGYISVVPISALHTLTCS